MKKTIATITGLGSYLPERALTNADLEKMVETSHEWIVTRSGIVERRIAAEKEYASTMGIEAAKKALEHAGVKAADVDCIIVSTMTPDFLCPSTAAIIQHGLQAHRAFAFDIQAACSGFIYGLSLAKAFIESGAHSSILVIATEKNSAFVDYTDRTTCVLFGDGAGAALVQKAGSGCASGYTIDHVCLGTDGEQSELICIPASGCRQPATDESVRTRQHYLKMVGSEVYKHAVRRMEMAIKHCLEAMQVPESDISWLIPHQANLRIMEAISKRFSIPWERVVKTIEKYGNTSSSTVPIALHELDRSSGLKQDERCLLVAFGGGLTWGASLLTKI